MKNSRLNLVRFARPPIFVAKEKKRKERKKKEKVVVDRRRRRSVANGIRTLQSLVSVCSGGKDIYIYVYTAAQADRTECNKVRDSHYNVLIYTPLTKAEESSKN